MTVTAIAAIMFLLLGSFSVPSILSLQLLQQAGFLSSALMGAVPMAMASPSLPSENIEPFIDDAGFMVNIPPGWIANDYQNTDVQSAAVEDKLGYTKLATFCPSEDATPSLGSEVPTCNTSFPSDSVQVFRYKHVSQKPEFAPIVKSGKAITSNDIFLYHLEELKRYYKFMSSASPPGASPYQPNIKEEYTVDGVTVDRHNPAGGENFNSSRQQPITDGKIAMIDDQYSLFIMDPNTDYGYRVTAGGFTIVDWTVGISNSGPPESIISILNSVGLGNINPANQRVVVTHPLIPYVPPTGPDATDPGAIVVATAPPPSRTEVIPGLF
jgi:hypothetical protein